MDWWLITFFLGALLSLFLPVVPSLFYVVFLVALSLLVYRRQKTRYLTAFMLGCAWMLWSASQYQSILKNHQLPQLSSGKPMTITGVIDSIPQNSKGAARFNMIVAKINQQAISPKIKVRLSWQASGKSLNIQPIKAQQLKHQQQWQLLVRVKPAHGLANLGGFSYQTWLTHHGIHATGYVIASPDNQLLSDTPSLRQNYYDQLTSLLPQHPLSAIILALSFGERSQLTKAQWQVLSNTATVHLIAISGLHLGLVASCCYLIINGLIGYLPLQLLAGNRTKYQITNVNHKYVVITLTCLLTGFYGYLAGFSLPTIRALIMIALFWLAKWLAIKLTLTRWLALALFFITWCFPMSLVSTSFWLSFYAVSIIFLLLWRFDRQIQAKREPQANIWLTIKSWFVSLFLLQLGLITLMLPLTLVVNQQISLVALPANLLAVPWMSVTSIPLSMLAVMVLPLSHDLSRILLDWALLSIKSIWAWLQWLSQLSLASVDISSIYYLVVVIIIVALFIRYFIVPSRKFYLGYWVIGIAGMLTFYQLAIDKPRQWTVNVMDVGQGLAVVVEANRQVFIYDTGASFKSGFSMAEAALIPFIKQQGYQSLDLVIISHDDNDHSGGLAQLQTQFAIRNLIYNALPNAGKCRQGQRFNWQFLTIEMLWPKNALAAHNDDSCVIKVSDGRHSVLLTGDISRRVEHQLLLAEQPKSRLNSDVLIVPHHGSKSSSSHDFIREVSPQIAIFSAGYLNRWQMPTEDVIKRYQAYPVKLINTAEVGMIRLAISPKGIELSNYREQLWPFWFAN